MAELLVSRSVEMRVLEGGAVMTSSFPTTPRLSRGGLFRFRGASF